MRYNQRLLILTIDPALFNGLKVLYDAVCFIANVSNLPPDAIDLIFYNC